MSLVQTKTPYAFLNKPNKADLLNEFLGKSTETLRTPAMVIDRHLFARNCAKMHKTSKDWGATFRAHLKTHKTVEGTRLQLVSDEGTSHSVVVSTIMEAWEVVQAGLVADSTVKDILYGLPVAINKVADLSDLWEEIAQQGGIVRLIVDHPNQIRFLEDFESRREVPRRWSIFVKINGGQNRAGVSPESQNFRTLLSVILKSHAVTLHGFYGHAGNSYASTSITEASDFLSAEVDMVNRAASIALLELPQSPFANVHTQPFVLSVGSTPTAHAASAATRTILERILHGQLELHAGNYPMLDLQQQNTGLIDSGQISQKVLGTVISYYPGRGKNGGDEAMIDAGAIAFSKDTGPIEGYGQVIGKPWVLSRISQEHGILTPAGGRNTETLQLGTVVEIIGQHACLIAAAYPWYYIVDKGVEGGIKVVDIWVPWKGW